MAAVSVTVRPVIVTVIAVVVPVVCVVTTTIAVVMTIVMSVLRPMRLVMGMRPGVGMRVLYPALVTMTLAAQRLVIKRAVRCHQGKVTRAVRVSAPPRPGIHKPARAPPCGSQTRQVSWPAGRQRHEHYDS